MRILYVLLQLTWGLPQSLLGLLYLLREGKGKEHFWFHGAYVTRWDHTGGISLGMFIFIGDPLMDYGEENAYLTHEYGHTIQSMLCGPLYLFIVGIPSSLWAAKYTKEKLRAGISYFSVFPEGQANRFGERVTGIKVPDQLPMEMFELYDSFALEIGGVRQWVSIRGRDRTAPVLLVLHGGPGSTLTGLSHLYQRPWERHYIVVNWDQRCSGKTATISGAKSEQEITLERMLADALELTDYLRRRFHREKIVLLGHSWGTMMGAHLVQTHPERFIAYISTGTMVNTREESKLQASYYREKFEAEGNAKKRKRVEDLGAFWEEEIIPEDKTLAMNRILIEEGNSSVRAHGLISDIRYELLPLLRSPEYTLKDALNLFGYRAYTRIIEKDMPSFDLAKLGCEYRIPVYYIEGRQDMQTPYALAKAFYEKTVAPDKAFFTLDPCAHCWDIDAPEQMARVMCEELPPRIRAYSSSSASSLRTRSR